MQERTQHNLEEFSRIQGYMLLLDENNEAYKVMLVRYQELKTLLELDGVNMNTIDRLKR